MSPTEQAVVAGPVAGTCVYCHIACGIRYVCEDCDARFEAEQSRLAADRRQRRFVANGIPVDYAAGRESLLSYVPRTPGQAKARDAAFAWADRKLARPWLYLWGAAGRGKTHLAAAALVHRCDRAADTEIGSGMFLVFDDFVRRLQGTFRQDGPSECALLERVTGVDYLVVDDIGVKEPTSYASSILFAIVNERYNARRATVFTSNRNLREIGSLLAPSGESLQAERILSRIMELAIGLEVDGPDGRMVRS